MRALEQAKFLSCQIKNVRNQTKSKNNKNIPRHRKDEQYSLSPSFIYLRILIKNFHYYSSG
jgi:hypothetical protein